MSKLKPTEPPHRLHRESFAKILELLGGLVLLGSFVLQNYVYDKWDARTNELSDAINATSLVEKSIPLNEILYETWQNDGSLSSEQNMGARLFKLKEAVRKTIYAQSIPIAVADIPSENAHVLIRRMQDAGEKVHDLATYINFIAVVNEVTTQRPQPGLEIHRTREKRDLYRNWFLRLYIFGSAALLLGLSLKP